MSPLLEIEGLDLFYGDAQALAGVSLNVGAGEIVSLVGSNGAGKTSLIRAVAGIERAAAGRIRFSGRDITGLESHEICALGIGQVAEGRRIFAGLTVLDNLKLGALARRGRARTGESLEHVFGLFPPLRERTRQFAGTLSGGEQQMLAIARCLMSRPELIMFDEPSLGLAPAVVQEMLRTVVRLNETGISVLLVEQNVALSLAMSRRGYVLENGRIVVSGGGMELLGDDRIRRAYLGL